MTEEHETRKATVRRAPKFGVFIGAGIVVGVVVAVALTLAFPADPSVGMLPTVGYVSLYGIAAGALLGAIAALIADRVSRKRARVVDVERGSVGPAPVEAVAGAKPAPEATENSSPDVGGRA